MTGEMSYIDPDTGIDSNGDEWPVHLAVARAVGGELRAFDVYQGPYISVPLGRLWLGVNKVEVPYVMMDTILVGPPDEDEDPIRYLADPNDEVAAANAAKELVALFPLMRCTP